MRAADYARVNVWAQQPKKFFDPPPSTSTARWWSPPASAKSGWTSLTRALGGTIPCWSLWPKPAKCSAWSIAPGIGPATKEPPRRRTGPSPCAVAGFRKIVLRGDTAFSQSEQLDAWDAEEVSFYFGFKALPNLEEIAENLPNTAWQKLLREPRYEVRTAARQRPKNVKQRIIRRREFEVLRLQSEDYAEFEYRPTARQQSYRLIVLRKNISHEKGETRLFDEIRYFFYITNDWAVDAEDVVFEANDRCDQENLLLSWPAECGRSRHRSIISTAIGPTW